jgi:predicted GIY-YIG superfamily endonuclease
MTATRQLYRLYVLRCADGALFATMSDKPPSACVADYNAGQGEPFTKGRRPVSLAFSCDVGANRHDALGVVWVVRQLSRSAKERLCDGCPNLIRKVLARGRRLGARLRRSRGR